ncbi:hypothetical protein B0H15DRAFT_346353 [Mycena belliarum]|uniref:Uncharacterized protein n=1 Tax=Mycena belliarum TaxID=1033014 RepID=A0AAD6U5J7_9AGAR|nr:hypothetical protein B0H15DRAFT_346353 [Mycena belliae]
MARSILPGREPPSTSLSTASDPPPIVPSESFSELLPTDSEALEYPNKTLISVAATGVLGSLTTDERSERRSMDARYCARHFAGHVVLSPLDVVLARLGTSALADKLAELKKVACNQTDATLKDAVLENFSNESIPSLKLVDRTIDNRYWLSRLLMTAHRSCSTTTLPPLRSYLRKNSTATTRGGNTTPPCALPQLMLRLSSTSSSMLSSPTPTHLMSPPTPSSVRPIMWPSTSRLSLMRTTF